MDQRTAACTRSSTVVLTTGRDRVSRKRTGPNAATWHHHGRRYWDYRLVLGADARDWWISCSVHQDKPACRIPAWRLCARPGNIWSRRPRESGCTISRLQQTDSFLNLRRAHCTGGLTHCLSQAIGAHGSQPTTPDMPRTTPCGRQPWYLTLDQGKSDRQPYRQALCLPAVASAAPR